MTVPFVVTVTVTLRFAHLVDTHLFGCFGSLLTRGPLLVAKFTTFAYLQLTVILCSGGKALCKKDCKFLFIIGLMAVLLLTFSLRAGDP